MEHYSQFTSPLAQDARNLAEKWADWEVGTPLQFQEEFPLLTSYQQQEFLAALIKLGPIEPAKVEKLNCLYNLENSTNYYILVPFLRLGLQSRWEPSVARAVEIVTEQGTLEFTGQLYRELYSWQDKRQLATETFLANREKYMEVVVSVVSKDLNLD